ncbi:MAG: tol-pal system YbgF family protein [Thiohalomonadales bacterium]
MIYTFNKPLLFVVILCSLTLIACTSTQEKFDQAVKSGSITALKEIIKEDLSNELINQALKQIAYIALRDAQRINTEEAYQKSIDENPGNNHVYRMARVKIEALDYQKASQADTIAAYEKFIVRFPFGTYRAAAQSRMEKLDYEQLKKDGNEESLKKFLDSAKYNKEDIVNAQKSLEQLEFDKVVKINTSEAYQRYIQQHGDSVYAIKATERLLNLRLPSTIYLSDKGHISILEGKITAISKDSLTAVYGSTAKQIFNLSQNILICSKKYKKLSAKKLKTDLNISIATNPEKDRSAVIAIYIGQTKVAVKSNYSDKQPKFVDFPNCFPPLSVR